MLDLARHIVNQKAGRFEPDKFEDQYETALIDLINAEARRQADHRKGTAARRERGGSDGCTAQEHRRRRGRAKALKKPAKKPRKAASGSKGNADVDRRQEAGEGGCGEEAGGQTEVGPSVS